MNYWGLKHVFRRQPRPQFLKWYKTFTWLFGSHDNASFWLLNCIKSYSRFSIGVSFRTFGAIVCSAIKYSKIRFLPNDAALAFDAETQILVLLDLCQFKLDSSMSGCASQISHIIRITGRVILVRT